MPLRLLFYCSILLFFSKQSYANPDLELVEFPGSAFLVCKGECGIVVQKDRESGKLLRKIRFYRVFPGTETWFTHFFKVGGDIWAKDEKERFYKMEVRSLKPQRVELTEAEFKALKISTAKHVQ